MDIYFYNRIYNKYLLFVILILILFFIWLFKGGENHSFIGLDPILKINNNRKLLESIVKLNNLEKNNIEKNNIEKKICFSNLYSKKKLDKSNRKKYNNKKIMRSKGEEICCNVMEEIFKVPFNRVRPDFLKNPETGRNLEIDCYNEDLKIGVERNGIQHYVYPNFTNQSYDDFIKQVRRDKFKIKQCNRNGVYLMIVPYTVKNNEIRKYIIKNIPKSLRYLMKI